MLSVPPRLTVSVLTLRSHSFLLSFHNRVLLVPYPLTLTLLLDIFPYVIYGGVSTTEWEYVRETYNHYSLGPVTDVTSTNMTCWQLTAGDEGTSTITVTAGSTLSFEVTPAIYHPGPLSIWLGQVPSGETAATWDGSGAYWTKIYQDQAIITTSSISWPNLGKTFFLPPLPFSFDHMTHFLAKFFGTWKFRP